MPRPTLGLSMPSSFLPRSRKRVIPGDGPAGVQLSGGLGSPMVPYGPDKPGSEEMVDEVHPLFNPSGPATYGDVGGPMSHTKIYTRYGAMFSINYSSIVGTIGCGMPTGWVSGVGGSVIGESALNALGTTMVARSLPTNPAASLTTFLGELRRDGLPHLPGAEAREITKSARASGSEYLNIQFGWLPFVADLRKFAYAVKHSNQILSHYVEQSGRKNRVRFNLSQDSAVTVYKNGGFAIPAERVISLPEIQLSETRTAKTWFSGAFRYYVPVGNSTWSRLARYEALSNHLLGTRLTPETVWNVAPWTWAIDWFTNSGDVIHNIVALGTDGLVMQYGYAMNELRIREDVEGWTSSAPNTVIPPRTHLTRQNYRVYQRRVAANPYGFGITDTSLTAKQLSILGALGLTQGRRQSPGKRKPPFHP